MLAWRPRSAGVVSVELIWCDTGSTRVNIYVKLKDLHDFSLKPEWSEGKFSLSESERIHLALGCFIMRSHKLRWWRAARHTASDWLTNREGHYGIVGGWSVMPILECFIPFKHLNNMLKKKSNRWKDSVLEVYGLSGNPLQDMIGLHSC